MVVTECLKIFNVQCIWGRILCLLKRLLLLSRKLYFIYILHEIYMAKVTRTFLDLFFLGAHTIQTVPKYIWMQHFLYQKKIVQDKWVNLGLKMAHPHNTGSAPWIFLKFCRMKGANRYMEILLVVFLEKIHFGTIWSF